MVIRELGRRLTRNECPFLFFFFFFLPFIGYEILNGVLLELWRNED